MKKVLLTLLTFSVLVLTARAQGDAHHTRISAMQADGRGETAITIDDSSVIKIWSLKDGKLVAAMKQDSPEWFSKQVRYKYMIYGYGLSTDLTRKLEEPKGTAWDYYAIRSKESVVGHLKFPKDAVESEDYNRATGKLILHGVMEGKGYIWLFDPQVSTTEANVYDSYKLEGTEYFNPDWSPKGNYLIDLQTKQIWNMATGKKVSFDKSIVGAGTIQLAFTPEEDKVSIATKDGITVLDTQTGATLATYDIPAELKIEGPSSLLACSDGKSFVYRKQHFIYVKDPQNPVYRKAWLVTEGKVVTELVE